MVRGAGPVEDGEVGIRRRGGRGRQRQQRDAAQQAAQQSRGHEALPLVPWLLWERRRGIGRLPPGTPGSLLMRSKNRSRPADRQQQFICALTQTLSGQAPISMETGRIAPARLSNIS